MNTSDTCANCGKEGTDVTNTCNKCKLVMYCNAACKKKHRHKHKKECERRVAELHDEKLFKLPPPKEDCPICMIRLPYLGRGQTYMACCGKVICNGCVHAFQSRAIAKRRKEDEVCPFCRTPPPDSDKEIIKRYEKRMELNDGRAVFSVGSYYARGLLGLRPNQAKALELWRQAAELGSAEAYYGIACCYKFGRGVERDEKMAMHYTELAAMSGDLAARYNLGGVEEELGNMDRALKHYMIAAKDGDSNSLEGIKLMYKCGHATKDDYAKALSLYQAYLNEVKSDQRDEAAAAEGYQRY